MSLRGQFMLPFVPGLTVLVKGDLIDGSIYARVAELADALVLGTSGQPWGFESPPSH